MKRIMKRALVLLAGGALLLTPITAFADEVAEGSVVPEATENEGKENLGDPVSEPSSGMVAGDEVEVLSVETLHDELDEPQMDIEPLASGNWVTIGTNKYYYENGVPAKGSRSIDGKWYYFSLSDGHMLKGSHNIDGKWYRYDPTAGYMLFGSQKIDGKWYRYDPIAGYMLFGSQFIDGSWYRYDPIAGYMLFGSMQLDGKWYRYDPITGKMLMGSHNIDGKWYRYDPWCGYMVFGAQYLGGYWYWYDQWTGEMRTGFQNLNGSWYWYDLTCGYMLFGTQNIYGYMCYFNAWTGVLESTNGSAPSIPWLYPYSLDTAIKNQVSRNNGYTYSQYNQYMNPYNYPTGTSKHYVFMKVNSGYTGITAAQIDAYIAANCLVQEKQTGRTSTLRGIGGTVVAVSKQTGINEAYILAHAILESGWGCSRLSTGTVSGYEGYYNFFGIGAYDTDPLNGGAALAKQQGWSNPATALAGGVAWINKYYISASYPLGNGTNSFQNTLYKMRFAPGLANTWHQYATSLTWAGSIADHIGLIYKYTKMSPTVPYEVPVYP